MPKRAYTGVGGVAKKLKTIYIGVNNKAKVVKKAYMGVDGKAKVWWDPDGPKTLYFVNALPFEVSADIITLPHQTDSQESSETPRIVFGKPGVYRVSDDFTSVTPLWTDGTYTMATQGGTTAGYSDRMLVATKNDFTRVNWSVTTNDMRLHVLGEVNSSNFYNGIIVPSFSSGESVRNFVSMG